MRISSKLKLLGLFNAAAFALIVAIVSDSFIRVEDLSVRVADTQMTDLIESASLGRVLSATLSDIRLLSRSCHEGVEASESGNRLIASLTRIAAAASERPLKDAVSALSSTTANVLQQCAAIHGTLGAIAAIDRHAQAEMETLETLVSRSLIEHVLAGKPTDHLDQIMSLVTGYRETLLQIGRMVAEQGVGRSVPAQPERSVVSAIDDLALRLQTITASTPEVTAIGKRLSAHVARYRQMALRLGALQVGLNGMLNEMRDDEERALGVLKALDRGALERAELARAKIGEIVQSSRRIVLGLAGLVALLTGSVIMWIVHRSINRPLRGVVETIAAVRAGTFEPRQPVAGDGEWGTIQSALADMAAQLQRSTAELRLSRERLDLALQGADDGIWDWNLETNEVFYSQRWKSIVGYAENELVDTLDTWKTLVDPAARDRVLAQVAAYLDGRGPHFETEFRMRHKEGHWVDILSRAKLAVDAEGRPLSPRRLVGTHVDITERKRTEEKLVALAAELEARIAARTTELARALQAVTAADRAKSEFMSTVTHELRTPLNAVIGFAELLKDEVAGPLNPKQAAFASDILDGGRRLLELVEGILEMSRLDAKADGFAREPVEIGAALAERLAVHRKAAEADGITMRLDVAPDTGSAELDPKALCRMLDALIDNAIKFNRAGGAVTVRARRAGGALEIAVADTGIGIARKDFGRLFKPLVQLDSGLARAHGGIGLGLALARRLAEVHGGTIEVDSEPGQGSTFTLRLPLQEKS